MQGSNMYTVRSEKQAGYESDNLWQLVDMEFVVCSGLDR